MLKPLVLFIAALIGSATFVAALLLKPSPSSPYFGFLWAAGIALWLRDVRKSPPGSEGPNWRSFFFGSATWIALAVGLLIFENWLATVPAGAVSPSAIGACFMALGVALVGAGVYSFRGHPSQRLIDLWSDQDGYVPIYWMFSAGVPMGLALGLLGAVLLVKPGQTIVSVILIILAPLVLISLLFLVWQPRWARPRWAPRDDER